MSSDVWLLLLIVFGLLVVLGATSGIVSEKLWLSEPLVCVAAGIAIGPHGAGLLTLDPARSGLDHRILLEGARFTLGIAVTGAALRLPAFWLRGNWRGLFVALGPGMVMMWLAGAAIAWAAFGLSALACLLAGAAIAPTDPVLSAPILTGRLAERAVPAHMRDGLTAESGVNDGLALPLVMLPIFLMSGSTGPSFEHWLVRVVLQEILSAALVGIAIGWGTAKLLGWARSRPDAQGASLLTVTIALAIATMAAERLLGGDEILAAFCAGAMLSNAHREAEAEEHHERFSEALARFFDLPIMVLFGVAIPWAQWSGFGWRGLAFAAGILLLRRIPAWLLLGRFMPWTDGGRSALFAGWFGPIGAAALFYAMYIQDELASATLWPVISLAVGASVLAHGMTGMTLTRRFGAALDRAEGLPPA